VTAPDDGHGPGGPTVPGGDHIALAQRAPGASEGGPAISTGHAGHEESAVHEDPPVGHRKKRPRRTALSVLAVAAVTTAAALAATGVLGGGDGETAAPTGRSATAKVQRTTLTATETVDGKLGYGDVSSVVSSAAPSGSGSGSGAGLVTWAPEAGDVIERGENVYSVDQRKTPLLYGRIPIYRTLKPGDSGSDVRILEQNLQALGYDGFTADADYTAATAAAVQKWQDDLNREQTGTVKPGEVVVAPGPRKVSAVKAQVGAPPTGTALSWTADERVVTVDLEAQYEDLVRVGTKATVELPDGSTVEASVTEIGTPTNDPPSDSSNGDDDKEATLPVELKVRNQKGLGNYQAASVDVILESKARKDVLAVPVNALVARNGGGYALKVVKPSAPSEVEYVPVKLGMFSDSMVEVSGAGITEGTVVEAPK
jgi:peptidoglycan hydrolase-like protein with peptidoglycan-binding domain